MIMGGIWMLALVESFLTSVVDVLWGPTLLIGLLGTGLYFCIRTGFWQIRNFPKAFSYCFRNMSGDKQEPGSLTPYQAASIAIASAIGVGNIGGVASAIALGGPGVMFWMWVTALIGMMTKMVEVALAVYYRDKRPDGTTWGGPTFYLEKGFKSKLWIPLAWIFGLGIMTQYFISLENYTVSEALSTAFHVPQMGASLFYGFMCAIVIFGGLKRLGLFASMMVPFMSILYVLGGLVILGMNAARLPGVFATIVSHAFTPTAAVGGFAGSALILTIRTGIARSLYSNEAGWGTSPMAHATAKTDHPIHQGMWGIIEVFIDTFVVCSITGLVIITTGAWESGKAGASLTMEAFRMGVGGFGFYFVAFITFLFSWTTSTGWSSYFQTLIHHAFRDRPTLCTKIEKLMRLFYVLPGILLTAFILRIGLKTDLVWLIADMTTALPTYVNMIALLVLSKKFLEILSDYERNFAARIPGKALPVREEKA